jgi:hypothetical protein
LVTTKKTEAPTIEWGGASGTTYKHWIYPIGTPLAAKGGNYVFAKEIRPKEWTPIYIGQTSDLSTRFEDHHKKECIKRNGATHIHAHLNAKESDRLAEEADLLKKWGPACND